MLRLVETKRDTSYSEKEFGVLLYQESVEPMTLHTPVARSTVKLQETRSRECLSHLNLVIWSKLPRVSCSSVVERLTE